jgi:hypothetical protein
MLRKAGFYYIEVDPDKPTYESDGFVCKHCQKAVFVKPGQKAEDMGGHCKMCDDLVCSECVDKGCDPFEKKLERMEAVANYFR